MIFLYKLLIVGGFLFGMLVIISFMSAIAWGSRWESINPFHLFINIFGFFWKKIKIIYRRWKSIENKKTNNFDWMKVLFTIIVIILLMMVASFISQGIFIYYNYNKVSNALLTCRDKQDLHSISILKINATSHCSNTSYSKQIIIEDVSNEKYTYKGRFEKMIDPLYGFIDNIFSFSWETESEGGYTVVEAPTFEYIEPVECTVC